MLSNSWISLSLFFLDVHSPEKGKREKGKKGKRERKRNTQRQKERKKGRKGRKEGRRSGVRLRGELVYCGCTGCVVGAVTDSSRCPCAECFVSRCAALLLDAAEGMRLPALRGVTGSASLLCSLCPEAVLYHHRNSWMSPHIRAVCRSVLGGILQWRLKSSYPKEPTEQCTAGCGRTTGDGCSVPIREERISPRRQKRGV